AQVALVADRWLARVQADPHPDVDAVRPRRLGVRALDPYGRADRVARPREREEERVALAVDLDAVRRAERGTDDPPMLAEDVAVPLSEPAHQRRGGLDVGERERHRAAREGRSAVGRESGAGIEAHTSTTAGAREPSAISVRVDAPGVTAVTV